MFAASLEQLGRDGARPSWTAMFATRRLQRRPRAPLRAPPEGAAPGTGAANWKPRGLLPSLRCSWIASLPRVTRRARPPRPVLQSRPPLDTKLPGTQGSTCAQESQVMLSRTDRGAAGQPHHGFSDVHATWPGISRIFLVDVSVYSPPHVCAGHATEVTVLQPIRGSPRARQCGTPPSMQPLPPQHPLSSPGTATSSVNSSVLGERQVSDWVNNSNHATGLSVPPRIVP